MPELRSGTIGNWTPQKLKKEMKRESQLIIMEQDRQPIMKKVNRIIFPTGSLSRNRDGSVNVSFDAGGAVGSTGAIQLKGARDFASSNNFGFSTSNKLTITGSVGLQGHIDITGDMVLSGTLYGGSPLKLGSGIEMVGNSATALKIGDNQCVFLGADNDTCLMYRTVGRQYLDISGSAAGIVLSGSSVKVDGYLGIGTDLSRASITHGITLPDTTRDTSGMIKATAYLTYSSRKYKKNIKSMDKALGKLDNLRAVTFDWKDTGKNDIGFIVEEIEKELPEVIGYDHGIPSSMDYAKMTSFLLQCVKEQQLEIKELKRNIVELSKN